MKNENRFYVYLHIRLENGEPFYVGRGQKFRMFEKCKRGLYWQHMVAKYGYDIIVLEDNLTHIQANEREIYWINRIGRKDLGLGTLINLTDGGDGIIGYIQSNETKEKRRQSMLGKNTGKRPKEIGEHLSKILTGKPQKGVLVLDTQTGVFFDSITAAAKCYGLRPATLNRYLYGIRKNNTNLKLI